MRRTWRITLGAFVLGALSACNESSGVTPIGPSSSTPPPASASPPPLLPGSGIGRGTVAIRELNPGVGATLRVRNDCLNVRATVLCTESWRGIFDVLVDRDMTNAVLTAGFYDGNTICAYAAGTADLIPAGSLVSLTMTRIQLSDHTGKALGCQLPAITNRIKVELWSDSSSWSNTLIQEFVNNTYTFSERTQP
jgi:hypothetical protein